MSFLRLNKSVEYKMFSVTYNGVADTSWYDEFKDETDSVETVIHDTVIVPAEE